MRFCTDYDYRKDPKTSTFCFICQRDLKKVAARVYTGEECHIVVDKDEPDFNPNWIANVGPECVKQIPKELLI